MEKKRRTVKYWSDISNEREPYSHSNGSLLLTTGQLVNSSVNDSTV